jgi:hypothetical protein
MALFRRTDDPEEVCAIVDAACRKQRVQAHGQLRRTLEPQTSERAPGEQTRSEPGAER